MRKEALKLEAARKEALRKKIENGEHPVSFSFDEDDEELFIKISISDLLKHYQLHPEGFNINTFYERLRKKIYYLVLEDIKEVQKYYFLISSKCLIIILYRSASLR